jgi:mannose-6-phosphate isomerase-like protein (cupin superfamily)
MQYIFHLSDKYSFEKVGHKGKTFDTKSLSDKVEFSIIETEKGHETKIIEKECIFSYYILGGSGVFEINGLQEKCAQGDLVVIPKGTAFQYTGTMKMLLVSVPWWFSEQEVTL